MRSKTLNLARKSHMVCSTWIGCAGFKLNKIPQIITFPSNRTKYLASVALLNVAAFSTKLLIILSSYLLLFSVPFLYPLGSLIHITLLHRSPCIAHRAKYVFFQGFFSSLLLYLKCPFTPV